MFSRDEGIMAVKKLMISYTKGTGKSFGAVRTGTSGSPV